MNSPTHDEAGPKRRAASSTALLRATKTGVEVLVAKRSSQGSFADAWVFPGGMLEADDERTADFDETLRRAAVREFAEECGVILSPNQLHLWSCWLSPRGGPKAVANWIFVADASEGNSLGAARVDGVELTELAWLSPNEVLRRHADGGMIVFPPTWVTLYHLRALSSIDRILGATRGRTAPVFASQVVREEDQTVMSWPATPDTPPDPGHHLDITALPWRYEVPDRLLEGG